MCSRRMLWGVYCPTEGTRHPRGRCLQRQLHWNSGPNSKRVLHSEECVSYGACSSNTAQDACAVLMSTHTSSHIALSLLQHRSVKPQIQAHTCLEATTTDADQNVTTVDMSHTIAAHVSQSNCSTGGKLYWHYTGFVLNTTLL